MTLAGRSRRRLTGIEGTLAADTRLASMFAMFNALNRGEPARGPDPLPRSGWRAQWPWLSRVAALVAMVAVIVGGLLLSSAMRPVVRSCLILSPAGAPVTVPVGAPAARAAPSRPAFYRGHVPLCRAYPANK